MNFDNLHELINRYESNIDLIYNEEHDELFKWKAMKVWREEWNKPDGAFASFADRFNSARREFSLFIDNSRMHPSTGIIKLWEKEPCSIERLFYEVLFADTHGDISAVHSNMDRFIEEYENLRCKYYPRNWSFKQDRHSASVFLAMNEPTFNFVFKASEAQTMARYIDFGLSIGAGESFSLTNYYRLCEEIVSALKEHPTLLEKHFNRLTSEYYYDQSLHLLAFDLMYCAHAYDYFSGLTVPSKKKEKASNSKSTSLSPEQQAQFETERNAKISSIEQRIAELQCKCDDFSDISLIGVQVTTAAYGVGTVTNQEGNKIVVRFDTFEKSFILDERYSARPRFEDDEQVIAVFTEYGRIQEQIKSLHRDLAKLQA